MNNKTKDLPIVPGVSGAVNSYIESLQVRITQLSCENTEWKATTERLRGALEKIASNFPDPGEPSEIIASRYLSLCPSVDVRVIEARGMRRAAELIQTDKYTLPGPSEKGLTHLLYGQDCAIKIREAADLYERGE